MTFRNWLAQKWYEHLEELESYRIEPEQSSSVYFNRYKHWLRRQYKLERKELNAKV